jgi:Conjugative transposon protein TcpC
MRPFVADELSDQAAVLVPSKGPGAEVAQAMVVREVSLHGPRTSFTVAALMEDGRRLYLSVPIARDDDGGLVVADLPSFSPPPPRGESPAAAPMPVTGAAAVAIGDVTRRFVHAYIEGADAETLAYFVAPGAEIAPMSRGLRVRSIEAPSRESERGRFVSVGVRVQDTRSRAVFAQRYRVALVHRDRWYVAAVLGGPE